MTTSAKPAHAARARRVVALSRQLRKIVGEPRRSRLRGKKALQATPPEFAQAGGLNYVSDQQAGIRRKPAGKDFVYFDARGRKIRNEQQLRRIRALAIPPAWADVWICADSNGHLQATGRDARGRKQYRYHARWREVRDESKYERVVSFGRALPEIRRTVARHLKLAGLPREKVLAAIVQLLEKTLIRVGNDEYARDNSSYGLTTMLDAHVAVRGAKIKFRFRGKSGREHDIDLEDPRLAKIVKSCRDLPNQELFAYINGEGEWRDVTSTDVNEYLKTITQQPFTAKDFRTFAGTVLAAMALQEMEAADTQNVRKKNVLRAIESVAERLGNTKAVCRKCYIHPEVLNAYLDGSLAKILGSSARRQLADKPGHLRPEEAAVLKLLQHRLEREAKK
jgi:DNA topoisomerase I